MGKAAPVRRWERRGDRSLHTEGEADRRRRSSLGQTGTRLEVIKERSSSRLIAIHTHVVYGDPEEVRTLLGDHSAYVERTHLTSQQMNAGLVRKGFSYSKQLPLLRAASSWQDWISNLTRPVKTLQGRRPVGHDQRCWQARTPAMAAGLTDHIWTVKAHGMRNEIVASEQ